MPLVNVRAIKGVFSAAEKRELIKQVTDAMVAVKGENVRQVLTIIIDEVNSGDWAVDGKPLTTAGVRALLARPVEQQRRRVR
jgi:4-oxalocrotonate tautomerase